jgi:hypothetical protein
VIWRRHLIALIMKYFYLNLSFMVLQGMIIHFMYHNLSNRYIRTIIYNDINSTALDWPRIRQGVPQGLVLGPLLLHINDLPKVLNRFRPHHRSGG